MMIDKTIGLENNEILPEPANEKLWYYWSPFALKDTRELVRDGVLNGTVTRLRERLSKAAAVFDIKRLVLWAQEDESQERTALFLLVFQAEHGNAHNVRLYFHMNEAFSGTVFPDKIYDELVQYFIDQAFWRISVYLPSDTELSENPQLTVDTVEFLKRIKFDKEATLADYFLTGIAPQAADLWNWSISSTDFEAFFLAFGDGALIVSGNSQEVDAIYFCAYGETIHDGRTFLIAYKRGYADSSGNFIPSKRMTKGQLSKNMSQAYDELKAYLKGEEPTFTFSVKAAYGSEFQEEVWRELKTIPYGVTNSYLEVARRLSDGDDKKAHRLARAVGSACSSNPLCIVTPCHRVIGSDNSLTGFNGGVHFKARLLDMEMLGQSSLSNEDNYDET